MLRSSGNLSNLLRFSLFCNVQLYSTIDYDCRWNSHGEKHSSITNTNHSVGEQSDEKTRSTIRSNVIDSISFHHSSHLTDRHSKTLRHFYTRCVQRSAENRCGEFHSSTAETFRFYSMQHQFLFVSETFVDRTAVLNDFSFEDFSSRAVDFVWNFIK